MNGGIGRGACPSAPRLRRTLQGRVPDFERFDTYAGLLEALYEELRYVTYERIKTKLAPAEFRVAWDEKLAALSTPNHSSSWVMSLPPPRCSPPLPPGPADRRIWLLLIE